MAIFLDVLPVDNLYSIAYYLFGVIKCGECDYLKIRKGMVDDEYLKTFLEYAKNSRAHLSAVMWVMSHRLYITEKWREGTIVDWISATASQLQELDISEASRFSFCGKFPSLPKLRKAAVTSSNEHLSLIHGCPNLLDLRVNIETISDWDNLLSTLASLPLKSLFLDFSTASEALSGDGEHEIMSVFALMRLCSACSILEKFRMSPPLGMDITPEAWKMIRGLQSLKTLAVNTSHIHTEGDHIAFMQNMAELELHDSPGIERALSFGSAIRLLEIVSFHYSYEQTLRIISLPNLKSLTLVLHQGAEKALVWNISNVEELKLTWLSVFDYHPIEVFEGEPQNEKYPVYYEPDISVLENILKTTKSLTKLKLEDVILSSETIERLLAIIGQKLENIGLCYSWQKESTPERMERIFKAVTRYCPNVKSLEFCENCFTTVDFIMATENQKKRCLRALEQLVSARLGFQSYRIIRSTIENRFVHERPFSMLLSDDVLPN